MHINILLLAQKQCLLRPKYMTGLSSFCSLLWYIFNKGEKQTTYLSICEGVAYVASSAYTSSHG